MNYSQIRSIDISNGEGVGAALFVQGCHFKCKNCFNSDTWNFDGGEKWTSEVEKKFLKLIDRDYITRISFLGGECLADENVIDVYILIEKIKKCFPEKKIWMHTGYIFEDIIKDSCTTQLFLPDKNGENKIVFNENILREKVVELVDVLIDGRYIHELRNQNLKFRGSSNQRVIDVQKTLKSDSVILYLE